MATFSVYMIRHGQTYFNKYRRMQGWCDSPLTTVGENDAVNAGKMLNGLKFDAAYASDMTRAMRTANLLLPASGNADLTVQPLAAFREAFYGYFEGDDTSQTWFEVGAPTVLRHFRTLLTSTASKKPRTSVRKPIRSTRRKTTPNSGNASTVASIPCVRINTTATRSYSSATAIRFIVSPPSTRP